MTTNTLTKEQEKRFDEHELFSKDIKILDPVIGCDDPECCEPLRIINYELKQHLAQEIELAKREERDFIINIVKQRVLAIDPVEAILIELSKKA